MAHAYDVIVIGAGHNGLVAACYLARAGLKVCVLERRPLVGGACASEELWPGYRVSTASYVSTLFEPRIVRELGLESLGYRVYKQEPAFFHPFPDGRYLMLWGDERRDAEEFRKFSARDAERLPEFHAALERLADLVRTLVSLTPPCPPALRAADLIPSLRMWRSLRRLTAEDLGRLVEVASSGILDYVEPWFESEAVRAFYCSQGVIGAYGGVRTPGTAALLLHDFLGGVDGVRGVWGVVEGGMGSLASALAAAAREMGAEVRTGAAVREVLVEAKRPTRADVLAPRDRQESPANKDAGHEAGRAVGVRLDSGEELRARAVVSNADPQRTFLALTPARFLPPSFRQAIERYRCLGASLKVHLALGELPDFTALRTPAAGLPGPQHRGLIVFCPSPGYIDRAWEDAQRTGFSAEPMVECCLHSVLDASAAPAGKHVMSCFVQYGPRHLPQGSWAALRETVAERVIATLARYAPNLPSAVEHWHVYTPEDLEMEFGLSGGNIYHGAMIPGQLFCFRPAPGFADYRTPVAGLYLCGSGAHPGGGVWGAAGRNASREILRDLRRARRS